MYCIVLCCRVFENGSGSVNLTSRSVEARLGGFDFGGVRLNLAGMDEWLGWPENDRYGV